MTCQHDPMFTTDGRCSKCYPPKRVVMVQHDGGAQEVHSGWFVSQTVTNERARKLADEKMSEYGAYLQDSPRDWNDIKGDCDL